ncbi:MAG: hypothetical protein DWQ01_10860 [Planctomycetota bacterium]|nr:MAG: hypothetical protein DWQ01_10860 [Planctomycetota bacterium]
MRFFLQKIMHKIDGARREKSQNFKSPIFISLKSLPPTKIHAGGWPIDPKAITNGNRMIRYVLNDSSDVSFCAKARFIFSPNQKLTKWNAIESGKALRIGFQSKVI